MLTIVTLGCTYAQTQQINEPTTCVVHSVRMQVSESRSQIFHKAQIPLGPVPHNFLLTSWRHARLPRN